MGNFSMNKSIEVTLRMQVILLDKSIEVSVFKSTIECKNRGQTILPIRRD